MRTEGLTKSYGTSHKKGEKNTSFKAVDNVNLHITRGCSLGVIGESGCGKSTLGRLITGLERPSSGSVIFDGSEISGFGFRRMRPLRKQLQIIFQNSSSSFDPRYTIGATISESLANFCSLSAAEFRKKTVKILTQVGLNGSFFCRYPDELSGGQLQRANIARALVLQPQFVVCDEPVSSLDFSIRHKILNLLDELKEHFGLTYLFISHDLSTVQYICNEVAIMYLGKIVERVPVTDELSRQVSHPYSRALFDAIPVTDPSRRRVRRASLGGEAVSVHVSSGCPFQPRCPYSGERCLQKEPELIQISERHWVACHRGTERGLC